MPEACNFVKKETLAQVFSCEFCKISKNKFFTEHLRTTASNFINHKRNILEFFKTKIFVLIRISRFAESTAMFLNNFSAEAATRWCSQENSQENTCIRVSFLILKADPGTGVSLRILRKFEERLFYRTPPDGLLLSKYPPLPIVSLYVSVTLKSLFVKNPFCKYTCKTTCLPPSNISSSAFCNLAFDVGLHVYQPHD